MTFDECLSKMVAPGQIRASKPYRNGVIQIHVTRACNLACYGCTQGSNLGGHVEFMSPEHFEQAVRSLGFRDGDGERDNGFDVNDGSGRYFGVVGVFGGNPAMSPHFFNYCRILQRLVPFDQRGLWCNHPKGKGALMRSTFNPRYSNINVHLDQAAYDEFRRDWPEVRPVGLTNDSRHSPVMLAMKDVVTKPCPKCHGEGCSPHGILANGPCEDVPDYDRIWELVSACDINQNWSAMIGVSRGELRAWFCEVAGAQSMLHQHEPEYPDTGIPIHKDGLSYSQDIKSSWFGYGTSGCEADPDWGKRNEMWWQAPMHMFADQVRKHCVECGVPLRGYGELSQAENGVEKTSKTHANIFKPKRVGRKVEVCTDLVQLGIGKIERVTHYLQNASR